jgi:hypothetical protein
MPRDGCLGHGALRRPDHRARARIRERRRGDRDAGDPPAQRRSRSLRHHRPAHVPASDRGVGRTDARTRRRLSRCAAIGLFGRVPRFRRARRADRLQARSAADPPGAGGDHAPRARRALTRCG